MVKLSLFSFFFFLFFPFFPRSSFPLFGFTGEPRIGGSGVIGRVEWIVETSTTAAFVFTYLLVLLYFVGVEGTGAV